MTATITGELKMTKLPLGEWRLWRLDEPLAYKNVRVPAGFTSDGASVPRPLWWLLPSWGRYSSAAIVHDYLCRMIDNPPDPLPMPVSTRREADAVFYDAMVECGVNTTLRLLIWSSVRLYAILWRKR